MCDSRLAPRCFPLLMVALWLPACTDEGKPLEDGPVVPAPGDSRVDASPARERWVEPDITVGPPVTMRLATWNVKDFFDGEDDLTHNDDVPSAAEVSAKIKAIGAALRALDADVVALEEVENLALLSRLNAEELGSLKYTEVRLQPGNDPRGINVGVLSRFSLPIVMSHAGDRFKGVDGDTTTYGFSRDCLEVSVQAGPGRTLRLLVNHFAATDGAESISRRHAQAAQVRRIADDTLKYKPDGNLAVVGDLNDTPESETLQLLEGGSAPLLDLLTLAPAAERYTYFYGSKKEQIDYLLVSTGLKADYQSGSIKADHAALFKTVSDHYPVVAQFTLE